MKKNSPEVIKSSYIFNVTKFVSWPIDAFGSDEAPFRIGVFGDKSIELALIETLSGKKINGRAWEVDLYKNTNEIQGCHLIFTTGSNTQQTASLIRHFKNKHVLTIGDNIPHFCESGGMINITGDVPNLGFEISQSALSFAKLEISSGLLDLATII
ncbi:MAG: hypothetical protein B6I20_00675 [Bacteroidetes bacterium 4572_117]|nr:MAG: hypothetical protein B6I20_00675 [Bacteroidetes bacterium 4572_117]